MSLTIVNGYPCSDCADIAKAKRGENPNPGPAEVAGPSGKVAKPADVKSSKREDAVSFGGSLAGLPRVAEPRTASKSTLIGGAIDYLA